MEEDTRLKQLLIGTSVNIKRTDGRIHQALVAEINDEIGAVTVEWIEKGETKGKEVELNDLFYMNPDLLKIYKKNNKSYKFSVPTIVPLSKNHTKNDLRIQPTKKNTDFLPSVDKSPRCSFSAKKTKNPRNLLPKLQEDVEVKAKAASKYELSRYDNETHSYESDGNKKSRESARHNDKKNKDSPRYESEAKLKARYSTDSNIPKPYRRAKMESKLSEATVSHYDSENCFGGKPNLQSNSSISDNKSRACTSLSTYKMKRSNVVKEVERLKKNREQRRAKQAEEKAEKEFILSRAPGPYWELKQMVEDYQTNMEFKPINLNDSLEEHQITVCVRKRPINKSESSRKEVDVISVVSRNTVIVHEPKNKVDLTKYMENQFFRFDYVFNETCSNELVYKFTAQPLVDTIFEGSMATCFAYGQTGAGKTHTMSGDFVGGKNQNYNKGIYALVAKDIFQYLQSPKYNYMKLAVSASFFEIYSGKVFDLLSKKTRLRVLEDGKQQVQIVGLTERVVKSTEEVLNLIQVGSNARTSGQTSANSNSSRSHAVFQLILRKNELTKVHGKISLIDLAGNERGSDTSSADRSTRMEGAEINKSLLSLKECIRALGKKNQSHLPFRASKLTQILRDSFIGENSRTCMIAMISPSVTSCEHTLNTLRYADRVKELAVMNDDAFESLRDPSPHKSYTQEDISKVTEVVTDLVTSEDTMVENHKTIIDFLDGMIEKSKQLYNQANAVDYDQDRYSQEWEKLLDTAMEMLKISVSLVKEFRIKLKQEEQLNEVINNHRINSSILRHKSL